MLVLPGRRRRRDPSRAAAPSTLLFRALEKIPRAIELTVRGVAGHGSVPLKTNADRHSVVRCRAKVAGLAAADPDQRDDWCAYFKRLADISTPEEAKRYRAALSLDPKVTADRSSMSTSVHEPRHASMMRSSMSPNIFTAGYRVNVIPSEAKATIDTRLCRTKTLRSFWR